jgi:signal transduction histidine kinase
LFAVSTDRDTFQLFEVLTGASTEPLPGRVRCSAAYDNHIVVALDTSAFLSFEYADRIFHHRFTAPLPSPPTQLAFYFKTLLLAFERSFRVATVTDTRLRYRHCVLALPSPIVSLASHGFIWAVFADGRLATLLYEPAADRIEFLAASPARTAALAFPIDDLSVAAVSPAGSISLLRIRPDTFRGVGRGEVRDYAEVGSLTPRGRVTAGARVGECVVYFADRGTVGGIVGLNCASKFRALMAVQREIKCAYAAAVGFSVDAGEASDADSIDLDLLDSWRRFAPAGEEEEERRVRISELTGRERQHFSF